MMNDPRSLTDLELARHARIALYSANGLSVLWQQEIVRRFELLAKGPLRNKLAEDRAASQY